MVNTQLARVDRIRSLRLPSPRADAEPPHFRTGSVPLAPAVPADSGWVAAEGEHSRVGETSAGVFGAGRGADGGGGTGRVGVGGDTAAVDPVQGERFVGF